MSSQTKGYITASALIIGGILIGGLLARTGDIFYTVVGLIVGSISSYIGYLMINYTYSVNTVTTSEKMHKMGFCTIATVIDYETSPYNSNDNKPKLDIIIMFNIEGKKKIARIPTSSYSESDYPINSHINIIVYNGDVFIDN